MPHIKIVAPVIGFRVPTKEVVIGVSGEGRATGVMIGVSGEGRATGVEIVFEVGHWENSQLGPVRPTYEPSGQILASLVQALPVFTQVPLVPTIPEGIYGSRPEQHCRLLPG